MRGVWLAVILTGCFFKPTPSGETQDADTRSPDSRAVADGSGSSSCTFSDVTMLGIATNGWLKPGLSSDGLLLFHTENTNGITVLKYLSRDNQTEIFGSTGGSVTGTGSGEEFVRWDSNTGELDMYEPTQHAIQEYSMGMLGMAMFDKTLRAGAVEPAACDDGKSFIDLVMLTGALQVIDGGGATHVIYTPPSPDHVNDPTIGNADHTVIYYDMEAVGKALFRIDFNDALTAVVAGPSMISFSNGNSVDTEPMLTADGKELYFIRDGQLTRAVCQ
ncbi:MAG: hypothetical protein QM831_37265 [Kofleriaceae bacterium]